MHLAFGSGPAAAVSLRLSTEVATGRWSFGVEGRYDLPASARTPENGTARTSLTGGAFVPCLRARGTWACAVVMASRLEGSASRSDLGTLRDAAFFMGLGGRLAIHLALPLNFALRINGEILAHPLSFELVALDGRRLYRSSAVSATVGPTIVRAF